MVLFDLTGTYSDDVRRWGHTLSWLDLK